MKTKIYEQMNSEYNNNYWKWLRPELIRICLAGCILSFFFCSTLIGFKCKLYQVKFSAEDWYNDFAVKLWLVGKTVCTSMHRALPVCGNVSTGCTPVPAHRNFAHPCTNNPHPFFPLHLCTIPMHGSRFQKNLGKKATKNAIYFFLGGICFYIFLCFFCWCGAGVRCRGRRDAM
jgi:hypothetical protein